MRQLLVCMQESSFYRFETLERNDAKAQLIERSRGLQWHPGVLPLMAGMHRCCPTLQDRYIYIYDSAG